MDVLKPYIGIDINTSYKDIIENYDKKIRELREERTKAILDYHLNLFKNFNFRKTNLKRYMDDINDLCIDLFVINNIKQEYDKNNKSNRIEIASERLDYADFKYSYKKELTKEFDDISEEIAAITDNIQSDNCFSDICTLAYKIPEKQSKYSYFSMIEVDFEYEQDFRGIDVYYIQKDFYPIVLELEKLINSKSKEFKELILKEYNESY